MEEFDEFALALIDQLSVEINEETEITSALTKATQDTAFKVKFEEINVLSDAIFPQMAEKVLHFTGIQVPPEVKIELLDLVEFKKLKGRKVFAPKDSAGFVDQLFNVIALEQADKIAALMRDNIAKFFVYSTYAKAYISKISTTYGDYLDSKIFLNKFILSSYPQIILHKGGSQDDSNVEQG